MARTITRQTLQLFGNSGSSSNFGQFGSAAASAPVTTKTIATIQSLSAWLNGWQSAVALGQAPYLQDMNAFCYVMAYMQYYMFQEGMAEWDAGTTYFKGSVVKSVANANYTEFYVSLTDANTNQALPTRTDNSSWQFLYALNTTNGLILPKIGANLDMNSLKITSMADGSAATDAAAFGQIHLMQDPVYASETTGGSTASGTFQDIGATTSITPTSTSSQILIITNGIISNSTTGAQSALGCSANGVDLFTVSSTPYIFQAAVGSRSVPSTCVYRHSPGSVSAQTYKTRLSASGGSALYGSGAATGSTSQMILMEVK